MANVTIRWSGLALLAGASLWAAASVVGAFSPVADQPFFPLNGALLLLSAVLLLLALPGMYAKQAGAAGGLGLAGHVLLQTGIVVLAIAGSGPLVYSKAMTSPSAVGALFGIALILGLLLTGIA